MGGFLGGVFWGAFGLFAGIPATAREAKKGQSEKNGGQRGREGMHEPGKRVWMFHSEARVRERVSVRKERTRDKRALDRRTLNRRRFR